MKGASLAMLLILAVNCGARQQPPKKAPECKNAFSGLESFAKDVEKDFDRACAVWDKILGSHAGTTQYVVNDVSIRVYPMSRPFQCGEVRQAVGCTAQHWDGEDFGYTIFLDINRPRRSLRDTVYHEVGHVVLWEYGVLNHDTHHTIIEDAGL